MLNLNPIQSAYDNMQGQKLAGRNLGARESQPQGVWTGTFDDWNPRTVIPHFYEAIREAVPLIDAGINILCTLDGVLDIETESTAQEMELREFLEGVKVNDLQEGMQALYTGSSNEMYEQGHAIAEIVLTKNKKDIERLRLADSKGTYMERTESGALKVWYKPPGRRRGRGDGTDNIEAILRNEYRANVHSMLTQNGYRELDQRFLVYAGLDIEADNPYGVSKLRSMEFVARAVLTMENATAQTWARFGDPIFEILYKTNNKQVSEDNEELTRRRNTFAESLATALNIKKQGNSADVVNAIGKDDELEIKVLGADGQVLDIEQPMRHFEEQIVAKLGLPSWMLARHWSTAERLARSQGEIVLQQIRTRFAHRKAGLERIIATMLRARGRTWNKNDWKLVQLVPNLQDMLAEAQAEFLRAQAEMVRRGDSGGDNNEPAKVTKGGKIILPTDEDYAKAVHGHKAENYVEDEDELTALENKAEAGLKKAWRRLQDDTLAALNLPKAKGAKGEDDLLFIFDPATLRPELERLGREFVANAGSADGELVSAMVDAYLVGVARAITELDAEAITQEVRDQAADWMAERGMVLVTDATARAFTDDILKLLQDGTLDGLNPKEVASTLRQRFEAHNYDWERLARSEMAEAQVTGKLEMYTREGIEQYDWKRAGGACPICVDLEAGSPYTVGEGPRPMSSSHPNCRCTIVAVVPD